MVKAISFKNDMKINESKSTKRSSRGSTVRGKKSWNKYAHFDQVSWLLSENCGFFYSIFLCNYFVGKSKRDFNGIMYKE